MRNQLRQWRIPPEIRRNAAREEQLKSRSKTSWLSAADNSDSPSSMNELIATPRTIYFSVDLRRKTFSETTERIEHQDGFQAKAHEQREKKIHFPSLSLRLFLPPTNEWEMIANCIPSFQSPSKSRHRRFVFASNQRVITANEISKRESSAC